MTSPQEPHSRVYSHINGSADELLDRLAVSELCKGWPVYRDASEWMNFRSLFCEEAYVWTTWSGPKTIDDFIAVSREGKARGAHIQHRECGTLVELNPLTARAVGKMKATITQRFRSPISPLTHATNGHNGHSSHNGKNGDNGHNAHLVETNGKPVNGGTKHGHGENNGVNGAVGEQNSGGGREIEYDVDCDVRFIFFCTKEQLLPPSPAPSAHDTNPPDLSDPANPPNAANSSTTSITQTQSPAWRVKYVKLIYEKDKLIPVDGATVPVFQPSEFAGLPEGYRYLGAAQRRLGYDVDPGLVTLGGEEGWGRMYASVERWLEGGEAGLFW